MIIRNITEKDNTQMAQIIRATLEEFGANQPGTVYYDENIWHLSDFFEKKDCAYFVVEDDNQKIVGGGGIYPTEGLPIGMAELVKLYLLPETRGKGWGKQLIERCIDFATKANYQEIYIESMEELKNAVSLYEKIGFTHIDHPMGNSGHNYCKIWMTKNI